jgi:zinc protease
MPKFNSLRQIIIILMLTGISGFLSAQTNDQKFRISYEKFKLPNGLDVIFHTDKSDPMVAVAVQYHVGANREVPGKTGFAHLFEHMMFQESENIPQDQFFKKIQGAGGTVNGGTSRDGTVYYEVVPDNALEMVLWMESDRMGYLLNTVTQSAFVNQQNVVQNEKRQNYDNKAYGHMSYVIDKALFPENHPYNWQVIGEMSDLNTATLEDVKNFYRNFYGPNNATLVIAGNFDPKVVKPLVEKYFGEIKSERPVADMKPMPVKLVKTVKLFHEDNFAKAARLSLNWPVNQQYTPDSYALDVLASLLSDGKGAPLYTVLVKDKKLTAGVNAGNNAMELAGKFSINLTASDGISLADCEDAIFEAFAKFEKEGFTDKDLEMIKANLEIGFYNGISSVLGKSFQLARYNEYAGDPGFAAEDIRRIQSVTKEDVMRVYNTYIKGMPYVAASFVPRGKTALVARESVKANIVEEKINSASVAENKVKDTIPIVKTPCKFDRSVEPAQGPLPEFNLPVIWDTKLTDGMRVLGVENHELPLVQFSMTIRGGQLLETPEKAGLANIVSELITEGSASKTPEELEDEIRLLGASINVSASRTDISVTGSTLARNYEKTIALVKEILFEPRWDTAELALIKTRVLNGIKQSKANPSNLAANAFYRLLYGNELILSINSRGTESSVKAITIDDVKAFYKKNFSPAITVFNVAGDIKQDRVLASLSSFAGKWPSKNDKPPVVNIKVDNQPSKIYFIDVPGAKQSVITIGNLGPARTDPDFYPAVVMNYKLGGSFNGELNLVLREEKGYTYGARSSFTDFGFPAPFMVASSVRSGATVESVTIARDIMRKYREGISPENLEFTKSAMIKANAVRFETLRSMLSLLDNIGVYNLPKDYILKESEIVRTMNPERFIKLAQKYIDPEHMVFIVVGDAKTQLEGLKALGYGDPVVIAE